ncbi:cupin domain-containing protein [Amnibacterium setariae]|uniref:Cupin domain-containing protein n=1 Tax=Amnibacterium setariae TaxID=2306585 RepID=A0A3A1TVJ8_9MICO|nr:cupin domain-containing protein [Amnibacterium setariae]RIX27840.1 cupin domain-containing protein [Amnibacterium setariae]
MTTAQDWIDALGLEPLPGESGWWGPVSTSEASVAVGSRTLPAYSAIHYLLEPARPVNVWHWLEPDDTHVLVDGGPVEYVILTPGRPASRVVLGRDVAAGQTPVLTAPAGSWKALRLLDPNGFALMTTVVTPEWTEDRVRIGLPPEGAERWIGTEPWLTRELVERLNRP